MNKTYTGAAVILAVILLGGVGYFMLGHSSGPTSPCSHTAIAGNADIGGSFELIDETGKTVTDEDVIQKPTLVYFGYTFCPDICPLDSSRNAEALDLLQTRGLDVGSVFISVDPERDTPDVLKEFTNAMHPDMIGLTGSAEQIKAASKAYKTYYKKQSGDPEFYLVDHSTFTYLVFPKTGFVEFFRREATPEQIADTVACYVKTS